MIQMTDQEMWSLLFGLLAAFVVSFVKQPNHNVYLRAAIVVATCAVGAVVSLAVGPAGLDWDNWFHALLFVGVTAVGLYTTVLHNVLGDIEWRTTPASKRQTVEGNVTSTRTLGDGS